MYSYHEKMGFLNSDNTTTDLYSRFRTEGGRSAAVHAGLKNAFPEIFRRSDYAYSVDEAKLKDIIVEITGLKSNDPIAQAIKGTFGVLKGYIAAGYNPDSAFTEIQTGSDPVKEDYIPLIKPDTGERSLGLSYNINIVLPETSDLNVLNAIFKSVRENLLK